MGANERMHRPGRRLDALVPGGVETVADLALQGVGRVVLQPQRPDAALQVRGQRVQHLVHVHETGVAAAVFRHLQGVERAGLRRRLGVGHVGVPRQRAIVEEADRLAVFQHVRDDENLRVGGAVRRARHGRASIELPEAAAEPDQVRVAQPLVPHENDAVLEPRAMHRGAGRRGEFVSQVESANLGADDVREGDHLDSRLLVGLRRRRRPAVSGGAGFRIAHGPPAVRRVRSARMAPTIPLESWPSQAILSATTTGNRA